MIALFDYNRHNLIMESSFRFKGYDFLFFDEGIPYYSLFRTTRKLNSFWELKYAGEVLIHLNPDLTYDLFLTLLLNLSERTSGHVIRTYSSDRVTTMCESLFYYRSEPYVRRYRRIVFNDSKMLTRYEKMSIVGEVIGRESRFKRIDESKIYNVIEDLLPNNKKITYSVVGGVLKCTRQTISKYMTSNLKEIVKHHNSHLQV